MITVGSQKSPRVEKKPPTYWKYGDVPVNEDGVCIDLKYRPTPFDVCLLSITGKDKSVAGWWTGFEWFSLRLRAGDVIVSWKFKKELN